MDRQGDSAVGQLRGCVPAEELLDFDGEDGVVSGVVDADSAAAGDGDAFGGEFVQAPGGAVGPGQQSGQGGRRGDAFQVGAAAGAGEFGLQPLVGPGQQGLVVDLGPGPAEAVALRQRLAFLHRALGEPWPQVDDEALLDRADQWLEPELSRARRRADLERIPTTTALTRLLPWPAAGRLDELAPERITVPSGSRIRVDYSADRPVLAVKIQEVFGWDAAPQLADGRVALTIHLLSPAGRPAAVTGDLASFWRDGYRAVRADLRGRYPRHPWPEDPTAAQPTRRLNPRK